MSGTPPEQSHDRATGRPRVAVVIPVYNHERYVEEAIASVLAQTRPPDRLVVVDDGSRDGSVAAAERALASAGSIAVEFRVQTNRGTARTLNETISRLDEEVIGILNSDDAWRPNRLERLLPEIDPSRPSLAFSGVEFFGDGTQQDLAMYPVWMANAIELAGAFPTVGFCLLTANLAISSGNLLFSRAMHGLVGGFDEAMPIAHDWEFLLQSLRIAEPVMVPERLYRYRFHGTNTYRVDADPSGREIRLLHDSFLGWATGPTSNPLAPTPARFPRWFPFFAPLWIRFVERRPLVPMLLMRLSTSLRDGPDAVPAEIERDAISRHLARCRAATTATGEPRPADPDASLREASRRWAEVRRRVGASRGPATPRRSFAAEFRWADASTTVATGDRDLLDEVAAFTGLLAQSCPLGLARAELNALGDREVAVHGQLRRYRSREDRLIWLILTVGELLARHARVPLLHAAAIEVDGGIVLACGAPFAGKSTLTQRALARGLRVLGDDQVRVAEGEPRVQALPRPVKLRVPLDAPLPDGIDGGDRPLRGMLEEEETLMLRRGKGASPEIWFPVSGVVHLARHEEPRCTCMPLPTEEIATMLRPQLRGHLAEDPRAISGAHAGLLAVPHLRLGVGPRRTDEALDLIIRRFGVASRRDRGRA